MQDTTPKNINAARRQAASFAKAQTMTAAGYALLTIGGFKDLFVVKSPEGNEYSVDLQFSTCDCPAFVKHGGNCKHLIWAGMKVDEADEAAMWEYICAEHDARIAMEREGEYEFPAASPTLEFLEAMQARMVQDLNKARDRASVYKIGMVESRTRRVSTLECALEIVNEYWTKALVGRFDLLSAQTCTDCGCKPGVCVCGTYSEPTYRNEVL